MKIDYVSSAMDAQDFVDLFCNSKKIPGQQAQKYNRLMMQGLAENGVEVRAVTGRPVTQGNCQRRYLRGYTVRHGKLLYHYCSVLNRKGVKNIWHMVTAFFAVLTGQCDAVVLDVLNASIACGASVAARLRRKPCIGVVTDLPELMVTGTNGGHVRMVNRVIGRCTGYVLLTEAMNARVNPEGKPYVIIEALCDGAFQPDCRNVPAHKTEKCVYAGFLDARYGVKDLVDGFVAAKIPDAELHLYGCGPYADELSEIAEQNPQIIYHGTVMNAEVVQAEVEADLLINPRPTHEEFTKYSFPSKNMEYMASGTPVLTTDLPGMPESYRPYVYLIRQETAQGIADALKEVLALPQGERTAMGKSAKEFVEREKNNRRQSYHLIEMIQNLK